MRKDERMNFDADFIEAARDYRLLLDRGYPVDASIKLTGDRYRLDKAERMVLFRGVLPVILSRANALRRAVSVPRDSRMAVDGYNILFTITNYLRGHPLFISTDGFLRDAGGAHGRVADAAQFYAAIDELCGNLALLEVTQATFFLDAPIPRSAEHAEALRKALAHRDIAGEVILVPSADGFVSAWKDGMIATSDSAIIAKANAPAFDLARHILETRYAAEFVDLSVVVAE